jgi:methylmalonyl-CoA/ethylmalonyl-CoA epimerase
VVISLIRRIDHVGLVASDWEEARELLLSTFGFQMSGDYPETGVVYAPERTRNYFVTVGGETMVEVLVPEDAHSGVARYLAKRGPGLHHIAYACDDVRGEAQRLVAKGLVALSVDEQGTAAFFAPRTALGILTELVRTDVHRAGRE